MTHLRSWCLVVAFGVSAVLPAYAQRADAPAGREGFRQPFTWWKSEPFKTELGLTDEQSARVDKIFEAARPEMKQEWDALVLLERKLSRLIQEDADEARIIRQIDRVETARASANKTRALMLVQMRRVLTPEQRLSLDTLRAKRQQESAQRPNSAVRKRAEP